MNTLGCRTPERIDRLVAVGRANDRAAPIGNEVQHLQITGVEILVFIDDQQVVLNAIEILQMLAPCR